MRRDDMHTRETSKMEPRSRSRVGALCALFALMSLVGERAMSNGEIPPPKKIHPEQARKFVGQRCVVTFVVKSTKHAVKRNRYYVDSQEDFHDAQNLGIQIEEPMAVKICQSRQIDDLAAFLKGKTIRVTGVVFLQDDVPYIKVADPADLTIVETKPQG
jgi:hypothetical protein